jgi:hypothetical protein
MCDTVAGIAVGMVTSNWMTSKSQSIQNGSGVQPDSYSMNGAGSFPGSEVASA